MSDLQQRMKFWYDGESHACVGYSDGSGSACGKIMPPNEATLRYMERGYKMELRACVRKESMEVVCAPVTKLYSDNFLVENWGWIVLAIVAGYFFFGAKKPAVQEQSPKEGHVAKKVDGLFGAGASAFNGFLFVGAILVAFLIVAILIDEVFGTYIIAHIRAWLRR